MLAKGGGTWSAYQKLSKAFFLSHVWSHQLVQFQEVAESVHRIADKLVIAPSDQIRGRTTNFHKVVLFLRGYFRAGTDAGGGRGGGGGV